MATSGGRGPRFGPDSIVETNEIRDVRRRLSAWFFQTSLGLQMLLKKFGIGVKPQYPLDVEGTPTGTTWAKIGESLAAYVTANNPGLGLNAYNTNGVWKYGKGSTAHYAAFIAFGTTSGNVVIASTAGTGAAGDTAAMLNRVVADKLGHIGFGGAPATSGALDVQSTDGALIVPRMTTAQKNALTAADGMIVYDTTLASFYKRQAGAWVAF